MDTTAGAERVADRYECGEVLGVGGMAEVRAGVDRRLGRPVAIKTLLPHLAQRADLRARFEAEARSAARLSHPNAVAVFDVGEEGGRPYLVMERLPGETLADRLRQGPVDEAWLRGVAIDVLGALGAAHDAGIVHRDVKPGNVLITDDGRAKIADFGIAKSIDAGVDATTTGQLLGTPAYFAPERLAGSPATPSSDLYSLGVVLYEALAGVKPFTGTTPVAVAHAVSQGAHTPLSERAPDADPAFVAVIERAMRADPAARFASAAAMAEALATPADMAGAAATTALATAAVAEHARAEHAAAPVASAVGSAAAAEHAAAPVASAVGSVAAAEDGAPVASAVGSIAAAEHAAAPVASTVGSVAAAEDAAAPAASAVASIAAHEHGVPPGSVAAAAPDRTSVLTAPGPSPAGQPVPVAMVAGWSPLQRAAAVAAAIGVALLLLLAAMGAFAGSGGGTPASATVTTAPPTTAIATATAATPTTVAAPAKAPPPPHRARRGHGD